MGVCVCDYLFKYMGREFCSHEAPALKFSFLPFNILNILNLDSAFIVSLLSLFSSSTITAVYLCIFSESIIWFLDVSSRSGVFKHFEPHQAFTEPSLKTPALDDDLLPISKDCSLSSPNLPRNLKSVIMSPFVFLSTWVSLWLLSSPFNSATLLQIHK